MKRLVLAFALVFFIISSNITLYSMHNNAPSHLAALRGYEVLSVTNDLGDGERLVPLSSIPGKNETHTVTYIHTVDVHDESIKAVPEVTLNTEDGSFDDASGLINIETTLESIEDGVRTYVTTISLNRPDDKEERALLRTVTSIDFSLLFTN